MAKQITLSDAIDILKEGGSITKDSIMSALVGAKSRLSHPTMPIMSEGDYALDELAKRRPDSPFAKGENIKRIRKSIKARDKK